MDTDPKAGATEKPLAIRLPGGGGKFLLEVERVCRVIVECVAGVFAPRNRLAQHESPHEEV